MIISHSQAEPLHLHNNNKRLRQSRKMKDTTVRLPFLLPDLLLLLLAAAQQDELQPLNIFQWIGLTLKSLIMTLWNVLVARRTLLSLCSLQFLCCLTMEVMTELTAHTC